MNDTLHLAIPDSTVVAVQLVQTGASDSNGWLLSVSDWVTLFAALMGVLMGSALSALGTKWVRRRELTSSLHREFYGKEMGDVRFNARKRVPHVMNLTLDELDAKQDDADTPIWMLLRFYQRLYSLMRNDEVDHRHVITLFGGGFMWWYEAYIKPAKEGNTWALTQDMANLQELMERAMKREIARQTRLDYLRRSNKKRSKKLETEWLVQWPKAAKNGLKAFVQKATELGKRPNKAFTDAADD